MSNSNHFAQLPDEPRLARELKHGDPAALETLYNYYRLQVHRLVLRIVHDTAASEDIVHDAFARLWFYAGRIEVDAQQIGPLIFTIARRRALDHVRARGARVRLHETLGFEPLKFGFPTPDSAVMDRETAQFVCKALKKLNANQQRVIEMAYYRDLTQSQIAAELHQPLGTVKSWARSALSAMRTDMEHERSLAKTS
jgi:RNA polymerase sigma-70 factor (ECF subfamily)